MLKKNRKILKNTLALYVRQVLIVFVNLYVLRVVLTTLGVEDYGIYSVVAGFVTLLTFLPGTMASATQRFFSFALGQASHEKLKQIFSANWLLYAAISLIALLVFETIGLWFVKEHLSIPPERFAAALTLYHLTALSFIVSMFASPFMAIMIAHEDMHFYALLSIIEAMMKLVAAYLLLYITWDKLELYGQLILAVALINTAIYIIVCLRKYAECQFKKIYWNNSLVKEILGFTGWTLFGQVTTVFRNQAVTVLINQIFNPATVAARAVAMRVASQALVFSQHFNTGLYPPIIKTYAANQKDEMLSLVLNGSKLTFFLMWFFALPLLIEMETILKLWLKIPPPEAVLFTQLAIIESLILSLSLPLATAARAPGKMKFYELSLGIIQVGIFLVSWLILKAGCAPSSVFIVAIAANTLMFKVRLVIVKKLVQFPMAPYYKIVILPVSIVILVSFLSAAAIKHWMPDTLFYTALVVLMCMTISTASMYFIGLDRGWRKKMREMLASRVARLRWNA